MHYVFRSRAAADLIMMQPAGDQLLKIVGREPSGSGIIEAAALPAAIAAIEAAIAAERGRDGDTPDGEDPNDAPRVGLAQRAWPMLQLMKRSLAEKGDVVWGV